MFAVAFDQEQNRWSEENYLSHLVWAKEKQFIFHSSQHKLSNGS